MSGVPAMGGMPGAPPMGMSSVPGMQMGMAGRGYPASGMGVPGMMPQQGMAPAGMGIPPMGMMGGMQMNSGVGGSIDPLGMGQRRPMGGQ